MVASAAQKQTLCPKGLARMFGQLLEDVNCGYDIINNDPCIFGAASPMFSQDCIQVDESSPVRSFVDNAAIFLD